MHKKMIYLYAVIYLKNENINLAIISLFVVSDLPQTFFVQLTEICIKNSYRLSKSLTKPTAAKHHYIDT